MELHQLPRHQDRALAAGMEVKAHPHFPSPKTWFCSAQCVPNGNSKGKQPAAHGNRVVPSHQPPKSTPKILGITSGSRTGTQGRAGRAGNRQRHLSRVGPQIQPGTGPLAVPMDRTAHGRGDTKSPQKMHPSHHQTAPDPQWGRNNGGTREEPGPKGNQVESRQGEQEPS